jgi:hypothetical protein
VAAAGIQRFSNQYIGLSALARRLHVTGCRLARYLRKSGTPVLAVPAGPGERALFLQKEVAADGGEFPQQGNLGDSRVFHAELGVFRAFKRGFGWKDIARPDAPIGGQ